LGVFAKFETNLHRESQLEGIAKAKAEGVYKRRPASIDAAKFRELKSRALARWRLRARSTLAARRCIGCWMQ
jgi:DNA invertase Pin-like site-specific DNA recombinase